MSAVKCQAVQQGCLAAAQQGRLLVLDAFTPMSHHQTIGIMLQTAFLYKRVHREPYSLGSSAEGTNRFGLNLLI